MSNSLNQLRLHRDVLVMESLSLSSITDVAYRLIPNVISEMKGFISSFTMSQPAIQLDSNQKSFLNDLSSHKYLDLVQLHVYVPEGLSVSYKAYCEALEGAIQYAENLPKELSDYSTFLSKLLNNEDDLKSTDYAKFKYDNLNQELDTSVEITGRCFKKNNTTTEVKYGSVIQNNNEWKSILEHMNNFITRIEAIKRNELLKQIEAVTKLLDMLQGKIKRREINNISNEMNAKIADYTYIVARYLEYYSVTYYRIKTLAECIKQSVNKVTDVLNRK